MQELYVPALRAMGKLDTTTIIEAEPGGRLGAHALDARVVAADYRDWLKAEPTAAPETRCLIVALPNRLHVDAVRRALAAGWHVLAEKPLALRECDCLDLEALATASGRLLKVAMSRRYLASLRLAGEIVQAKDIGDVVGISIEDCLPFAWQPRSFAFFEREAGGVLADMGVHYLDFAETLVGPLAPLSYADDARGGVESSARFRLRAGDVTIDMRLSRLHGRRGRMVIRTTRGEIVVDKLRENEVAVRRKGAADRRVVVDSPFGDPSWPSGFVGSFAQMLTDMELEIGGEATRLADAADAARTAGLIEWAYATRSEIVSMRPKVLGLSRRPVLVTGGTGFIGGHLVERLTGQGTDVRVGARSPGRCANVARYPIDLRRVDVLDRGTVAAAVSGCRVVYHLATGRDEPNAARITIEGTRNVVEAAIAAGADCVVVLSSMYVLGFPAADTPVDEGHPYRPYGGAYGRSKAAIERWCLDRAKTSGTTRIVVLMPTCVVGPGGGAYTALPVDLAARGQLRWIDGGRGAANYVYVGNLIDAMVTAAEKPEAHGERFIINDGTVTWRQLLEPLVDRLRVDVPECGGDELRRLASERAFHVGDLMHAMAQSPEVRAVLKRSALVRRAHGAARRLVIGRAVTPDAPPLPGQSGRQTGSEPPPAWLAELYGAWQTRFSAAKAERMLGWRPRVSLPEAQAASIAWLVASGRLTEAPAADDAACQREAAE